MVRHYREIIARHYEETSFVESNIKSFDNFINKGMQQIVDEVGDIVPTIIPEDVDDFRIKLGKINIGKPKLVEADGSTRDFYPIEARLRQLTYSAPLSLEIAAFVNGVQREAFETPLGNFPIMLRSKYCHLNALKKEELIARGEDPDDPGGYFILNGNERVLIMVEDLASNKLFISDSKSGPSKLTAKVYSEKGSYRIPHTIEQMKDGVIYISFTSFKRVPIMAVIKALGLVKDQDISQAISDSKQYDDVYVNLVDAIANEVKDEDSAIEFLSRKVGLTMPKEQRFDRVLQDIDKYLLPHLGLAKEDRIIKAYNLCKIIKRFLMVAREGKETKDKDHYMNKRLKLSGDLLAELFRMNLRVLVNDMLYNYQRLVKRGKFHSLRIIIREKLLTSRIKTAMSTGTWIGGRKGISQNIDRANFLSLSSHLQRVNSLLSTTQENFEARALHNTHWCRLCLKKDTNVLLADKYSNRTLEDLQNCWNHHKVSTFNSKANNLIPSAISKYYTSNPKLQGKKVYKLVSESGRELIATEDHPLYTREGWKEVNAINPGDYVAIYPTLDKVEHPELPTKDLGLNIVTDKDIENEKYIKELREKELIPLTINNYKIEIIARLLGHVFSDGYAGKHNLEFYCGSMEDAESIAQDIRLLGFEPSRIIKKQTKIKTKERIVAYTTYMLSKGGALYSLLVASGAPIGKKTDVSVKVPAWLFNSSKAVKREFLAALLGGDGSKPRVVQRANRKSGSIVHLDNLIFHKKVEMNHNILDFAKDLRRLFKDLEIDIKAIKIEQDYMRKDGSIMLKCKIMFGLSYSNIKNLLTKIGYRYCRQKELNANYVAEWLRLREYAIEDRIKLKNKVKRLYSGGATPKQISRKLGINYRVIQGWLFESAKYKNTRLSQNLLPSYGKWLEKSKIGDSGIIWGKIADKSLQDLDDVRDFTTVEDTHSFIANGFVVHNCPIETPEGTPIGLRKNLAVLSRVTQEDVQEDKIIKNMQEFGLKTIARGKK